MSRKREYGDVTHQSGTTDDLMSELNLFIAKGKFTLLAHLDSGVRWGSCQDGTLQLAPDFAAHKQPAFTTTAVQQLRIFNSQLELFMWRQHDGRFGWRKTTDEPGKSAEYFDEEMLLWGTHTEAHLDGFTLLREGAQGLRHSPPLSLPEGATGVFAIEPPRLVLRHYLNTTPATTVTISRFLELKPLEARRMEQKQ